jgi:hypothetical protein
MAETEKGGNREGLRIYEGRRKRRGAEQVIANSLT